MIENTIPNFNVLYSNYNSLFDNIENIILRLENENQIIDHFSTLNKFVEFDTKLRLGMAMVNIDLNDSFVRRKMGDLKDCHLFLYKVADIWFAYETFFKLHHYITNNDLIKRKINWLNESTNRIYSSNTHISGILDNTNLDLRAKFDNPTNKKALKDYLIYCKDLASRGQDKRLESIINSININHNLPNLNFSDILTITYSIRNNFVHNGEVTIYPAELNYILKKELLIILYKFIVVITIVSADITIRENLNN